MDVPNVQEWMMLTVLMFCDQKSNHEIHENIVPWKFLKLLVVHGIVCTWWYVVINWHMKCVAKWR